MTATIHTLPNGTPPGRALPVSEVFGPVWQGEGPHAGMRCSFLRLGLCNLACEWCDTPYTWDRSRFDVDAECPPMAAADILAALAAHNTQMLVLTGGEPLIHATNSTLSDVVWNFAGDVDVETNGTQPPPAWKHRVSLFAVSPKLWTGGPVGKRLKPMLLNTWADQPNAYFKIVCQTPEQVAEVATHSWAWPEKTWIMPEGRSAQEVLASASQIEAAVAEHGFHFTLRMHTLMHGDERGF